MVYSTHTLTEKRNEQFAGVRLHFMIINEIVTVIFVYDKPKKLARYFTFLFKKELSKIQNSCSVSGDDNDILTFNLHDALSLFQI